MTKQLKKRVIALSVTCVGVLLSAVVIGMNLINYNSVVNNLDRVLAILVQNTGEGSEIFDENGEKLSKNMWRQVKYKSDYFSVLISDEGDAIKVKRKHDEEITEEESISYAREVLNSGDTKGFIGDYRFLKQKEGNDVRIVFLDCEQKIDAFYNFLYASIAMALAGFVMAFCVIAFGAKRIIRPIERGYEKQRHFITDAGHEIKTPMAIISANVDVLKMEIGQNECLEDIAQQVKRLTDLTQELLYLAHLEENENTLSSELFSVSELVCGVVDSFRALAESREEEFDCDIEPMLSMHGDAKAMEKLFYILLDNALKYSPEGSHIVVELKKQNQDLYFRVENPALTTLTQMDLSNLFERFYRTESSRNSETGGHGIGLSIAKAIVSGHHGKIEAFMDSENMFQMVVILPL